MTEPGEGHSGAAALDLFTIDDHTAPGVARAVGTMINTGVLGPGARLPTVRDLAERLAVSPATISKAWQILQHAGLIRTRGRNGTTVAPIPKKPGTGRYGSVSGIGNGLERNLATGTPDPALLPALGSLITALDFSTAVADYLAPPVIPELESLLRSQWPFEAQSLTVTNGTMDALARTVAQVVHFGSPVAVEDPTFPPLIDALEQRGAQILPVGLDREGPRIDQLGASIDAGAVAFIVQTRAQNPTGVAMSERRAAELAGILIPSNTLVIENDHAGNISEGPPVSFGHWMPDRTIRILGFSKSHGPDLRLAAMAGRADVVDAVAANRVLGPGWSSRLLQRILYGLLTDPRAQAAVEEARRTYARRRQALVDALAARGIDVGCADGINMWIPVADEGYALVTLATHGVAAAPGSPFCVSDTSPDHIRITVGLVPQEDADELARLIELAARPAGHSRVG